MNSKQEDKTLQDQLRDLALEIADTQSRVSAMHKELAQGESYLDTCLHKYQILLGQLSVLDQYIRQQAASQAPVYTADDSKTVPTYDYAQEGLESGKKPVQKVNK